MENNSTKNNYPYLKLAFDELKLLAEQGDAKAQFSLALRYKKGKDVEIDLSNPWNGMQKLHSRVLHRLKTILPYVMNMEKV